MMDIAQFARYDGPVVIQGHDIPDGDSIGSGFALWLYLKAMGKEARIIYGGRAEITKPSLLLFIQHLKIPVIYTKEVPEDALLITVDCQYGAGNVQKFPCARFAVIDHHRAEIKETADTVIRPQLASCCTLMWDLIRKTGYSVDDDAHMRDALFYGLFTDTNGLSELRHPLDRDLADIHYDAGMIKRLKNLALTFGELNVVSHALKNYEMIETVGLFGAEPCDPNVLGFTSDVAIQVEGVDCCVVYNVSPFGMKLSIRSAAREMMANEVAAFLTRDVGSGGGTSEKAGGFINFEALGRAHGDAVPAQFLKGRVNEYLTYFDHIYAGKTDAGFDTSKRYLKNPVPVHYAPTTDVFPPRAKITIRTLEGDVDTISAGDTYLMIGIVGEVYPIKREKFEQTYDVLPEAPFPETDYTPTVIDRLSGEQRSIVPFARACVPCDVKFVYARELAKPAKVFTAWDLEKYYVGAAGDYIVANVGDLDDCYIVRRDIFEMSYKPA